MGLKEDEANHEFYFHLHKMDTIRYDRDTLISIGVQCTHLSPLLIPDPCWPREILRENKGRDPYRRPRGKRAGVRNRLRARAHRAPLPSILLANVQSLENKLDDLRARVKFQRDIWDCNLLCFTETWLNPAVPDHAIQPAEFFSVYRMDRTLESGKSRGGGVCLMKPWVDKTIRDALRSRSAAYNTGLATRDIDEYKLSYSVCRAVKDAKWRYGRKLESQFQQGGSRSLWQGLRTITDYKTPSSRMVNADASLADELNTFYARFKAAANHASSASGTTSKHAERAREVNRFTISEHDVRRAFKRVNTRKAAGPDGITGRVLKACTDKLAPVFTEIFNLSLEQSVVPSCFKQSTIVLVPKKPQPACLNDYRPVALTSVVMKCFERLVRDFITASLPDTLDPLTFAYCQNRLTEDAIANLLHTTISQLDQKNGNYTKMLFVDYSSAFNTIIPSTLTSKLEVLGLSLPLCQWISNFLTDRPQAVWFADDTIVVGLISNNDEIAYLQEVKNLERWCQENNLLLNVSKTKELIVDFSTKQERSYQPLNICGTPVERVDSFRYLGVHITQDLSWSCHINTLVKKARQRLYHLRRLRDFKLPSQVLKTFYTCTIESVLMGSITSWFGNSTMQDRQALQSVVRSAERTIHTELPDLQDIYSTRSIVTNRELRGQQVVFYHVGTQAGSGPGTGSRHPRGAIKVVPALVRESGYYSHYFVVPMKDGGMWLILELCFLNRSLKRLRGTIKSILSSCMTACFGNCTISDRKTLKRIVRTAVKIIEVSLPSIMDIYITRCICKANSIVDNPTHPSQTLFTPLPLGKQF
ncbi:gastrula zinc finger protein XlCGF28.1-like [Silurus asotus]|uniref:Gastrula zinc finger protein XlCGF28.1-like n=1 Tax=Silurus asotus TaxID=30991 RepID=A0AAD5AHM2_SILAS|nr:gastrula zinc finger protein XlCGF28.1-like [Silurus asotus]